MKEGKKREREKEGREKKEKERRKKGRQRCVEAKVLNQLGSGRGRRGEGGERYATNGVAAVEGKRLRPGELPSDLGYPRKTLVHSHSTAD